jgi:hypothetical protein
MAVVQQACNSWPEQDAIDSFFSHQNLMPLKNAVTAFRLKVQEERDHLEKLLLMEKETEESIRASGRLAALKEVREKAENVEATHHNYADSYEEGKRDMADEFCQIIDAMIAKEERCQYKQ